MLDYISFLTYITVTAATPGPNNIMSMANAGTWGFKRSFPFNLGIWLGMTLVVLLCAVASNAVYGLIPSMQMPMQILGAVYMLYLGWKIFTSPASLERGHVPCLFSSGMFLQFINAKYYLYCIMSLQVYILPHYQGNMPALLAFSLLLSSTGFAFTVLWAFGGVVLSKLFTRHAKVVNTLLALCMVYCALSLFW